MDILEVLHSKGYDVLNIYPYGSRVYGSNPNGDYDYIAVVKGDVEEIQISGENFDVTIYNENDFNNLIENHEISILECLYLPKDILISNLKEFNFVLDLNKLRGSLSKKASNSFVKAKKKLTIEKDYNPYIAKKSLFHSLRILMFGIQIAEKGRIYDYSEANCFWTDIVENPKNDWEYYKEIYQPIYNSFKTRLRKLVPMEEK
jgi:hypothetical protein